MKDIKCFLRVMNRYFFFLLVFFAVSTLAAPFLNGQDKLVVVRAKGVDLTSHVFHVAVDSENNKWVSTNKGLFLVKAPESAQRIEQPGTSLYQFPSGNAALTWDAGELDRVLGGILSEGEVITAAAYDAPRDLLWIGTESAGAYALKTKPKLTLETKLNASGTKTGASTIHTILIEQNGKTWIGTDAGVFFGTPGKWKQEQKYFTIQSIVKSGTDIWVLGDALVWKVSTAEKWEPIELPLNLTEGQATALSIDAEGRIWLASERIARYDPTSGESLIFGPADYYTTQFPTCMAVDLDGAVWIGSQDKGLFVVDKASAWRIELAVQKPLDCNAEKYVATLNAAVTGGTPPFAFRWNTGQTTQLLENVGPGTYSVTISDAKGAEKVAETVLTDTRVQASTQAMQLEKSVNSKDGSAVTTAKGGMPPYTYSWDNGEKTAQATQLGAGKHTVTISDTKGCRVVSNIEILRADAPVSVELITSKPVSCKDLKDGILEIKPSGGTSPYKITWQNANAQGTRIQSLASGSYRITVTDAKGVSFDTTFRVDSPEALTATIQVEKPAGLESANGQAVVQVTGGTTPYTFAWDNGENTERAVKLAAGKRTVQVSDANGCKTSSEVTISENILPLSATINLVTGIKCAGESQAALRVDVNGGKPPFSYVWSNPNVKGNQPTNLPAGNYALTIKDAAGNQTAGNFVIKSPDSLQLQFEVKAPAATNRSNGQASVLVTGGTPPYSYLWDTKEIGENAQLLPPGKRQVAVTDANGCKATGFVDISENILPLTVTISEAKEIKCAGRKEGALFASIKGGKSPFQIKWNIAELKGENPSGLAAGNYQVTVTDAAGTSATHTFMLKEPAPLKAKIQVERPANVNSSDGRARITISGGTPDYTFLWDNGESTIRAEKLTPGKRSITVTDKNGCVSKDTVELSENILPLTVKLGQTSTIACAGGTDGALKTTVTGGKSPFQFKWSQPTLTGEQVSGLKAGTYQVTVTDVTGKQVTASSTIREPAPLVANIQVETHASTDAQDGRAKVVVTGGTPAYSYRWDNQETTEIAVQLAPGKRSVTVTDEKGCTQIASTDIKETILPLTSTVEIKQQISCANGADGAVIVSARGGKKPYTYSWSNGTTTNATERVAAGTYTVTVTDALGASSISTVELTTPSAIQAVITLLSGAGNDADGQAEGATTGGSGSFTYLWDNQEQNAKATRLTSGNHTLTVTDSKGCTATSSIEIPKRLIVDLVPGKLSVNQIIQLEQIRFDVDSTNFNPSSLPMLRELADAMAKIPNLSIEIGGHTSSLCSDEFCDKLSAARAKSVEDFLVRQGISSTRVTSKGYGKRNPIAPNTTQEGRQKNQRVELKIIQISNP